jgi:DEAD/DEAH box helicase domain-containing protein
MKSGDVVFDIETQKSFDEVGGRDKFDLLKVSVAGAYVYGEDKYYAFEESEMERFGELLKNAGRVVGFNIHHFDLPVIQPYFSWNVRELPTLDLMSDVEKGMGFRVSLDNLCSETFGSKKTADGMQALRWFKEGRIEDIKKYCLKDVELTKKLYEYGIKNGHVMLYSRDAAGRVAVPVHWAMELPKNIRATLRDAYERRHSVEVDYTVDEPEDEGQPHLTRVVDVHKILNDSFEGYCHLRHAKRMFRIDRVLRAKITDQKYYMMEDVQGSLL